MKVGNICLYLAILIILLVGLGIFPSVKALNYLVDQSDDKVFMSAPIRNFLINSYDSDREYATCLSGIQSSHGMFIYSYDGFFTGSKYKIYSWCSTPIQLHSHSLDAYCMPSDTDLAGWKNFTSVKYFFIQCSPHKLMVYRASDLDMNIVKGFDYLI